MATITTRSGKGSELTHNELDANFTNLNTDKVEKSGTDPVVISVNSASDALTLTQSGSGGGLSITGGGITASVEGAVVGVTARYTSDVPGPVYHLRKYRGTISSPAAVQTNDAAGYYRFSVYGGSNVRTIGELAGLVEQYTSDTNISGYLKFSTTNAGTTVTERMRLDSLGKLTVGPSGASGIHASIYNSRSITGSTSAAGYYGAGVIQSDVQTVAAYVQTAAHTSGTFSLNALPHFYATQGTIDANSTVTSQYGFYAQAGLTGATNNYGFYSEIAAATGRWNFYAAGTAANYFAGDMQLDKTVTTGGTTGAQTINKNAGSVNFAASATSLVVTNSRVTTSSIIIATVATNDTTMKSVAAVAASGSFTLHANAAATAETRVNFLIIN